MNRKIRRMATRGVFRMDPLGNLYIVSKHNGARAARLHARHKDN